MQGLAQRGQGRARSEAALAEHPTSKPLALQILLGKASQYQLLHARISICIRQRIGSQLQGGWRGRAVACLGVPSRGTLGCAPAAATVLFEKGNTQQLHAAGTLAPRHGHAMPCPMPLPSSKLCPTRCPILRPMPAPAGGERASGR